MKIYYSESEGEYYFTGGIRNKDEPICMIRWFGTYVWLSGTKKPDDLEFIMEILD